MLNQLEAKTVVAELIRKLPLQVQEKITETIPIELNPDIHIVLLCYEKPEDFCHRHLVREWLCRNGYHAMEYPAKHSAKRKDNGEVVTGYYFPRPNDPAGPKDYIVAVGSAEWNEIDPATLKILPTKQ